MPTSSLIEATTLGDLLLRAAERWPERDALVFPDSRLGYRELAERARTRARALIAAGVEPGDHVGILSLNLPEIIETLFACALSGAVAVLLNARYRVEELRYVVGNADLRLLFTSTRFEAHGDFPALLRAALPVLPTSGSGAPAAATPLLRAVVALERAPGSGLLCGEEFLARAADVPEQRLTVRRAQVALGAPCIMMYTSGTTSHPKGCRLAHEAVVRSALGMNRRLGITGDDIMWNALPMFHMASILPLLSLVWSGGCFLSDVHFDAGRALEQIRARRATILYPAFPAIMADLLNRPEFDAQHLDCVRLVSNVAPPDTLRANMHALPRALHVSAYGMTEAAGISCHGAPDEDDETRATTCGRPYEGVQMRVVDPETGRALGAGERGEMRIRGFSLFEGYYRDPQRTAEAFDSEGWFRTGDLCSIGAAGQVSYHGRLKDLLKIGGENVSPLELESFIGTHPAVQMVQVVGVPDARLQEVSAAFIQLRPGTSAAAEDIVAFCRGRIASFKVPRHVRFVSEWPMSATKIQKHVLRARLVEELESRLA
jgi:acyl-CoA synthetase (AMP-forming)/AMP-acid ligase II